jgi:hypothetical protein
MCILYVIKKMNTCHFYRLGWRRFFQTSLKENSVLFFFLNIIIIIIIIIIMLMGAVVAVEFSRDLGLLDFIMEIDSVIVTQALKNTRPNWSPYGQLIDDARGILFTRRS